VVEAADDRRIRVDLSAMIRTALANAVHRLPGIRFGFCVQPDVTAMTRDARALADLTSALAWAIIVTPTASRFPAVIFDVAAGVAPLYALSLLGKTTGPTEPIAPGVKTLALAADALVWDAAPEAGEAAVVCFALEPEAMPAS
jgi:hypothetical protein